MQLTGFFQFSVNTRLRICAMILLIKFGNAIVAQNPALEVAGNGVLFPSFTSQERDALLNPYDGMLIYNTDTKCMELYRGTLWYSLCDGDQSNTVEDIDGNFYKTLKINNDSWMIENLRTTRLNDGTLVDDITSDAGWEGAKFPLRCRYNNSDNNILPYGYLYNGYAVADGRLCPEGWHVSKVEEWEDLINFVGSAAIAGGPLKESGTMHWSFPNSGATNERGFGALPGGNRRPDGTYVNLRQYGNYWAIDIPGQPLKDYNFEYDNIDLTQLTISDRGWGLSVRCVKD